MKIQILTDDGKVVDTYEDVVASDGGSEVFGYAIREWLRKTLRRGEEMQEPIIADYALHAEELKKKGERLRAQLAKLQAELDACDKS